MSLSIVIAERAEEDMALQYIWYKDNADPQVAERYLRAVDETIYQIARFPDLGLRRHFKSPALACIRSLATGRPFDKHIVFYQVDTLLRIERVIHGARDLPRRLLDPPDAP